MAEESRSKRKWIVLLVLILLLIICIILYLYLVYFKSAEEPLENINAINNANTNIAINENININAVSLPPVYANLTPEEQEKEKKQSEVLFFAMPFTERLGTYSNQSNFANLDELQPLMTEKMNNWVQNTYKVELRNKYATLKYYGVETKGISSQFNSMNDSNAEVMVKTQRSEYVYSPDNPRIFYQNIILKLIKNNDSWIVDGAYWQ